MPIRISGFNCGLLVFHPDRLLALSWYRKAAEQGHADAQFNVGVMYAMGYGVPRDTAQALHWYREAAEQGDADAQLSLCLMYYKGEAVPKDFVTAYAWGNLAAAQGDENAKMARDALEKLMTATQIAEAQALSREWAPKR